MSTQIFSGAISNMNKPDLVKIANALGIDPSGTVKQLRPRLKTHLAQAQNTLIKDARFQGLYQYRGSVTASKNGQTARKNSADKAAEDTVQEQVFENPTP